MTAKKKTKKKPAKKTTSSTKSSPSLSSLKSQLDKAQAMLTAKTGMTPAKLAQQTSSRTASTTKATPPPIQGPVPPVQGPVQPIQGPVKPTPAGGVVWGIPGATYTPPNLGTAGVTTPSGTKTTPPTPTSTTALPSNGPQKTGSTGGGTMGSYFGTPIPAGSSPAQIQQIIAQVDKQRSVASTGQTVDNQITNEKVAQGELPPEQKEDVPQTPEDYAQAIMDAMGGGNPDTSGVGTQSTQGEQTAVNESMAPTALGAQAPGAGQGISTGGVPGAPQPTTASGGYTKIGPAYFQKSADGLRAVSDKTVIAGLKNGTIPYDAGTLDGTTFSKYSVPLGDPAKQAMSDATKMATGQMPSGAQVDEGADTLTTYQALQQKFGITQGQTDFFADPMKTVNEMTTKIFDAMGMKEANDAIKEITGDLESLENDRDDEINDVNDNPWLTEGVRQRQIASIENRYEDKIANRTNKLRLLEDVRNNAQQQAQFALGTAISLWDKQRTFQQNQIDMWNEQAQREFDNAIKLQDLQMKKDESGKTTDITEWLFAKEGGYKGSFYDWKNPPKAGATTTSALAKAQLVDNEALTLAIELLNDNASGKSGAIGASWQKLVPWGQSLGLQPDRSAFNTKVEKLKAQLTFDNLGLLKGAMSDKDLYFLERLGSALNTNMSEEAFDAELLRVVEKLSSAGATPMGGGYVSYTPDGQPVIILD